MTSDEDFLRALRATFAIEAEEHLQAMATGLLELEQSTGPEEMQRKRVETIFRAAHSLKGAARAVDLIEIESVCESLEDTFAAWKRQRRQPAPTAFDAVHRQLDTIGAALARPRPSPHPHGATVAPAAAPPVASASFAVAAFVSGALASDAVAAPVVVAEHTAAPEETVRIAVSKLDAHVLEAEEMLAAKLATRQRSNELRALAKRFDTWHKEWTLVEPTARALRQLADRPMPGDAVDAGTPGLGRLLRFLDWNVGHVKSLEGSVAGLAKAADQDYQAIGRMVDDLLEDSKGLLSLPFATLSTPFPKLVRDLCRDQGKEAELLIQGDEVEIDKRVLEEMKAPLIHLLRNAIDHGIEQPADRQRAGKPPRATITLSAAHVSDNKVQLTVADDGAGIDIDKVREHAVKSGLLTSADAANLAASDARRLVFEPDVSTSPILTRVSGRGLGLAIVRENAEKLGGTVSVDSQPGQGTTFSLLLPSILATFRGILVEAAERLFVVPTLQVEHVAQVGPEEIRTIEGRDTIALNGRIVSLVSLSEVLELPHTAKPDGEPERITVLILGSGDQRIAFAVDAALDEQEVLVKPLRKPLSRVRNIAGATILGSGQVAPILNVADLLRSARKNAGARSAAPTTPLAAATKSVLVVEDSITSRMLIKGMLESAGYRVKTAVDGMEAFTLLRADRYDLVVSDVEMPRLSGFDLTAKIRADRKLADLPVVLVTALETREDRERGIDVGANAYIVKSKFDQSNLVEAVRRLA